MEQSLAVLQITDHILQEINKDNIAETVKAFSTLCRVSGSADAEKAAAYIIEKLETYGIPHENLKFKAFMSSAVSASLEYLGDGERSFEVVPCGFSKNVENLVGQLCYDHWSEKSKLSHNENVERFASFSGKIVLTRAYCSEIAYDAANAGALGIISMYQTPEEVPHYFGASNHNGSPIPGNIHLLPKLPCIGCTHATGEFLLDKLHAGAVYVRLSAKVDTRVKEASIPVAFIKGKSDNFVLMDGHYDCHCYGMTDNGAGDAIILELARSFYEHRDLLNRSIVVCWWAGHEFGQYAGSTWYSDMFYEYLKEHCVAHINIDIAGSKGAERIRPRTTRMEGHAFTADRIQKYTGYEMTEYIPLPHLGEQSFLGREIPITIMLKYEASPEMVKLCPVGGGYWWHSREDTIDKVDLQNAMRDAKINAEMICEIANSKHIPVDLPGFISELRRFLDEIHGRLSAEFDLTPIYPKLDILEGKIKVLCSQISEREDTDEIIKKVAGSLIQVVYTYTSPYEYDDLNVPSNFQKIRVAMDITRDNTAPEMYQFIVTDFIRGRNRLVGEFDRICDMIDLQLLKWNVREGGERPC